MSATLLKTKLYIPPAPPQLVARPRLLKQLDQGAQRKLALISAPPGFGKTTLLSAWVHHLSREGGASRSSAPLSSSRVAWVSLDPADNDPVRFWSYVIAALDSVQPDLGADAMALLNEPQSPPVQEILTALINAAVDLPQPIALILDDYHVIETGDIHDALAFLIDHLPPQMQVMITSRSDPPLPLTRLRVRSQLIELRDSDLRFTPAEAAIFLNQVMGLDLSPADIQALESRTEGWVAGLQLAALSMQGRDDTESFVRAFTGSHRYVIDYLAEEVLAQQPPHIRRFLLHTSILDRLCGPLCEAVLQPNDQPAPSQNSHEILQYLEQANLFLIPLDDERRWYRYHHLFADVLRENLQLAVGEAGLAALHSRASRWYAANDLTTEAVDHALAAGDTQQAIRLIEQVVVPLLTSGEVTTVQSWLNALPESVILARPRLSLSKGWALVIVNQWDQVEPYLEAADRVLAGLDPTSPDRSQGWDAAALSRMRAEAAAMRAMGEGNRGNPARAVELCEAALAQLPADSTLVRSIVTLTLGNAYEATGQLDKATQVLQETVAISQSTTSLIIGLTALSSLGRLQEEQGNLEEAARFYRQGLALVNQKSRERGQPFPAARWAYIELAELHREWNDLEEAKRLLTIALEMKRQINMLGGNLSVAYVILARVLQAEGDFTGALEAIEQARQLLYGETPLSLWIEAVQARLWLAQGNLSAASRWAETCRLPGQFDFSQAHYPHYVQMPGEYTTLVRVYLSRQQYEQALELLDGLQTAIESASRAGRLPEILLLRAITLHTLGQPEQALPLLAQALTIGQKGGYIRIFADEGQPAAALLRQFKARGPGPNPAYLEAVLAAAEARLPVKPQVAPVAPEAASPPAKAKAQAQLIEPLSDRELEVLQLVAEGLSNREIGERLFITVGTAKTHTINIYRKLEVNSRTQAVARAQELGLI